MPTALRPASWCCILRRQKSSTARMRSGAVTSLSSRSTFWDILFRPRKTMWREGTKRIFTHSFKPAASPKALTFISRTIRRWALHHSSDKSLPNLAEISNPCIRGWINYYSNFYRTQLSSTLTRIDLYVIRWARRKFKRLRRKTKGARDWFARLRRTNPTLFAHWQLCMAAAEHREPCESRGSCTVLGARGGEIPPRDSPTA